MSGFFLKNLPDRGCLEKMAEQHPEMNPDAVEVYLHFMRLGSEIEDRVSANLGRHGLSSGRLSILLMLNVCPEESRTPGDIAERCGVTAATVSRLVDGLISDGYVERVPDPSNRRLSPVQITESGRGILAQVLPGHFSTIAGVFGSLGSGEREAFLGHLKELGEHLNCVGKLV